MNNTELNDRLEKEIDLGEKASEAYALWVMNYINKQMDDIYETFKKANVSEYESIHASLAALAEIEFAIKQDIDTGKIARQQLNKGDVNE